MRNFTETVAERSASPQKQVRKHRFTSNMMYLIAISSILFASGCKKGKLPPVEDKEEDYYGYGKLTVECQKKCHVEFGEPGKMNIYDVESNKAVYFFRYQTKYNIDIYVTPIDGEQTMELNVFSREEKQIFNSSVKRNANETWYSK
ncbi:MAG: hypothetical protein EOO43_18195, partial [Flavobacterium sp.]